MDRRLFVDCDDTLILFDSQGEIHPWGFWSHDPYRINENLVQYIKDFIDQNPDSLPVIWSGGGKGYAQAIINEVLPDLSVVAMIKDVTTMSLVRAWDIVFDDQELDVPCPVFKPDWFEQSHWTAMET